MNVLSRMMWPRVAVALCTCALVACGQREAKDPAKLDEPPGAEDDRPTKRMDAFGLPLPPRVVRVHTRNEHYVIVETDMSIEDLAEFFKGSLKEHEVLKFSLRLHAVALKPGLPEIRASFRTGRRSNVLVRYRQRPFFEAGVDPNAKDSVMKGPIISGVRGTEGGPVDTRGNMRRKPTKGSPVNLRTPSGELLAPGAKWYEPYYPPPGSPLYEDKSNWGRPFGTWDPG